MQQSRAPLHAKAAYAAPLVAAEMIAGTSGIGYMTLEAARWYQSEMVVLGMLAIGIPWMCSTG